MMRSIIAVFAGSVLTLVACSDVARPTYPDRRGGRGERCLTLNDCKEPLVCGGYTCIDPQGGIKATGKQCVTFECVEDSDCCREFRPLTSCDSIAEACAGNKRCLRQEWEPYCVCAARCEDYACVGADACVEDFDCASWESCLDGRCQGCGEDAECSEGNVCIRGRCTLGCSKDVDCGPLEACNDRRCETRGCIDDRECLLVTGSVDALCKDGACVVPCENDGRCADLYSGVLGNPGAFVCDDGVCAPVGCERDTDCRGQASFEADGVPACIDAEQANELRSQGVLR